MKKKLAGLLTALMVLTMGTTAFAAKSPSSETTKPTETKPTVQQQQLLDTNTAVAKDVTSPTAGIDVAVPEGVYGAQVIAAAKSVATKVDANAEVLTVVDVTGAVPADGLVTFNVPGVQAGDNIAILHFNGKQWELIPVESVGNGTITGKFTSFSPVAFVKLPKKLSGTVTGTTPGSFQAKSAVASPKTGSAVSVLPVLAMICAAGIVVCGKKAKYNA